MNKSSKSDENPVYKKSTDQWDYTKQPPLGWTTKVDDVRIIDGDTIEFDIVRRFYGRLIDFDAPETWRPSSEAEAEHGKQATDLLKKLTENAESAVVHIPSSPDDDFKDMFSIGTRALVHFYIDGQNVTVELRKEGFDKKDDYEE